MTYTLGPPTQIRGYTITMLSRQKLRQRLLGKSGVALVCNKEPAFVVFRNDATCFAQDMSGKDIPMKDLLAICPAAATVMVGPSGAA